MKKLIVTASLGLALAAPSLSFADSYVFGVKTPVTKNEVSHNLKGGYVEKDQTSFYITPKSIENVAPAPTSSKSKDGKGYTVFGVKIPS